MEGLVFKKVIGLCKVHTDALLDRVDDLLVDITIENVGIHSLNEFDKSSKHFLVHSVCFRVRLYLLKHLVVGFPVVLKAGVVLDDQVDDEEVGQDSA